MGQNDNLKYSSLLQEKPRHKAERKTATEQITLPKGSRKDRKRIGRGRSTGMGKTSSRGHKGQKSRSGYSQTAGFEGGQMPLHRRLPKRGFTSVFHRTYQVVNLFRLERRGAKGDLTPEELEKQGYIANAKRPIKVLGTGEIKNAVNITADAFSTSAKQKIEAAGGSCSERDLKLYLRENKKKATS